MGEKSRASGTRMKTRVLGAGLCRCLARLLAERFACHSKRIALLAGYSWFSTTWHGSHVSGQYDKNYFKEFIWKWSLVPREDKCFCFWLLTWPQTSNFGNGVKLWYFNRIITTDLHWTLLFLKTVILIPLLSSFFSFVCHSAVEEAVDEIRNLETICRFVYKICKEVRKTCTVR